MKQQLSYAKLTFPAIIFVFVMTVVPILGTIGISFTSFNISNPSQSVFVGLENYLNLFFDGRFLNSVRVTLLFILYPVAFQMLLGLALALALHENLPGTKWVKAFFIIPMIFPPVVIGMTWKVFLTPQLGGLNYFLGLFGVHGPDWLAAPSSALWAVIIAAVWASTPFVTLMYYATLGTIPESNFEAAAIEGASWWQTIRYVSLPFLKTITKVIVIFRVLEALAIFPIIFVLTGGGPAGATEPINLYAYFTGFNYLKVDYAATLIVVFFSFLLAISWPILKKMVYQSEGR
jgi:multiple sugar transport system permease protein